MVDHKYSLDISERAGKRIFFTNKGGGIKVGIG